MKRQFVYAQVQDYPKILALIKERIHWMEHRGMKQWNSEGYLSFYTREYFLKHIIRKEFLLMKQEERVIGAVGIFDDDERWDHDASFLYLHHLVTTVSIAHIGAELLHACEQEALKKGKRGLRLDCQKGNERIFTFYTALGYQPKGEFQAGEYRGVKMEKCF